MVGNVLTGNGITAYGNGAYSLIGGKEPSATSCSSCAASDRITGSS
jgi:hypothetical protein